MFDSGRESEPKLTGSRWPWERWYSESVGFFVAISTSSLVTCTEIRWSRSRREFNPIEVVEDTIRHEIAHALGTSRNDFDERRDLSPPGQARYPRRGKPRGASSLEVILGRALCKEDISIALRPDISIVVQ
jgi:hypothetical protein